MFTVYSYIFLQRVVHSNFVIFNFDVIITFRLVLSSYPEKSLTRDVFVVKVVDRCTFL